MKNVKENKGITLIALIITIVVLLILAVVGINAVNEGNLFAHANNAAAAYDVAATEENTIIAGYLTKLDEYSGDGTSEQQGETEQGETDAIVGTWIMTDNDYTDTFVFNVGGTLTRTEKGDDPVTGSWSKSGNVYNIIVNYSDSSEEFEMGFNNSGNIIYFENGSPDSESPEYIKQ